MRRETLTLMKVDRDLKSGETKLIGRLGDQLIEMELDQHSQEMLLAACSFYHDFDAHTVPPRDAA